MKKQVLFVSLLLFLFAGCATAPIYPTIKHQAVSRNLYKYRQIAVLPFADAPGAPQSGQIAQGLAIQILAQSRFNVMEKGRLSNVVTGQQLSSSGQMDESQAVRIGKLLGVAAIVVGEVEKYSVRQRQADTNYFPPVLYGKTANIGRQGEQWEESFVSMSLRVIDVETSRLIYSGSGQYDRSMANPPQQLAEYILEEIIARWIKNPDRPQTTKEEAVSWADKGNENTRSNNWSEVIRASSAAIKIDPTYPVPYINRCWAYLEKGFFDEALADCQKALDLDSANPAAQNNMGLYYLRTGQPDKAKDYFENSCNDRLEIGCSNFKIITGYRPSEKVQFCLNKAEDAFNKQDWDGVIKYTSEIVTSESKKEMALAVRAGAYAHKRLFKEALEDCDKAIAVNPDYALSYNNKAYALELMGRHKEALLNYEFTCNLKMSLGCDNFERLRTTLKKQ